MSMAVTMILCFSKRPLLVKVKEVMVMDSMISSTLFLRDLGVRGSSS